MSDLQHEPDRDLSGAPATEMLREIVGSAHTCMLVTQHDRFPFHARPMGAQGVDADGTVWFLSASDSQKNIDIEHDPRVTLVVQDNGNYRYAQVSGRATIHRDRALIEKHWTPIANTWFEGKSDPRVTLIAVRPETGEYWKTKNGKIVTAVRMLLGAAGANVDEGGVHGQLQL
jgi:general stress protein 26